jgi:hypothetical protein
MIYGKFFLIYLDTFYLRSQNLSDKFVGRLTVIIMIFYGNLTVKFLGILSDLSH